MTNDEFISVWEKFPNYDDITRLEAGNVSVRVHGKGHLGTKPRADVVAAIKERRA